MLRNNKNSVFICWIMLMVPFVVEAQTTSGSISGKTSITTRAVDDTKAIGGGKTVNRYLETNIGTQQWTQRGIDIDGEAALDQSGRAVSLSSDGNSVAIGAGGSDVNGKNNTGHVRVYDWNEAGPVGAWVQRGDDIDGKEADEESGRSGVALSSDGNVVAIGSTGSDGSTVPGIVRVYVWNGGPAWVQRGDDLEGEAAGDEFGAYVSLSSDGNVVAIGARLNDGDGATDAGHVQVYDWNGGPTWVQRGEDLDGEALDDRSGSSVSLSSDGNAVAIGARLNDGNGTDAGHVRVYEWNPTTNGNSAWVQRGKDLDGQALDDRAGVSVSLSSDGGTVAIGANRNDGMNGTDAGHVRVYDWIGAAWVQRGNGLEGEAADDYSGISVSLSSDGNTLAVGAHRNDGGFGNKTGHVRVYKWNGGELGWVQRGDDLDGEAEWDQFGYSVSLSSDGSTVAVGARRNDGNGADAGHVRVFQLETLAPDDDPPHSGSFGDPHYKLSNGMMISSHGQCDYLLLLIPSFDLGSGLEVHIRTTRVDMPDMAYSYISGAAVRIGLERIEVSEDGSLFVNGELISKDDIGGDKFKDSESPPPIMYVSGLPLSRSVKGIRKRIMAYNLNLGIGKSIEIRVNTKTGMLAVDVSGSFADSKGLLGAPDVTGMIARDGVTDLSSHANSYVESWQVNDSDPNLFQDTTRFPQFPVGCVYESDTKRISFQKNLRGGRPHRRRLADNIAVGISHEIATNLCAGKEVGIKMDLCIADVMATGDLDLADEAFYNY